MNDPMINLHRGAAMSRAQPQPALGHFLNTCIETYAGEGSGAVANYIPELSKANPKHFGIALATIDGYVYEAGDCNVEFTIQSISKAFAFALALDIVGAERVEAKIGVEPSGEAFNSIRLTADNRPFNAMVNAGAITCSGLIHGVERGNAFERIRDALGRFAGRKLGVDEAVFNSERATGDRNRAIGYLLRNYSAIESDVNEVLDVYFRQCSILVTARDLAIMTATLANRGVNPLTGERVVSPYAVTRTLSVMTSSGMYDYAGEWVYRVGMPAKSGVGGGIVAALPGQIGLGTFSPLLDSHGNSVRGIKVCEELSSRFNLHVLNRSSDVRTTISADYDIKAITSRRSRQPHEQKLLNDHYREIRVMELVGALSFANVDFVSRKLAGGARPEILILDLRRVPAITEGAATLLADCLQGVTSTNITVVVSGLDKNSTVWNVIADSIGEMAGVRRFDLLDEAIEWAEDQIIYRYGGFSMVADPVAIAEQALLSGLTPDELKELNALAVTRTFHTGERIVAAGEKAASIIFLQSGMVSVKLPGGVRLASLAPGMVFGEMALIEDVRSADVWADTLVTVLELGLDRFDEFCLRHPRGGHRVVRNLSMLLAKRLILANAKIGLLSAN